MRVLHITGQDRTGNHGSKSGGLLRFLDELVPEQQRLGIEVQIRRFPAVRLKEITTAASNRTAFEDLEPYPKDEFDADIIHFHDWYGGEFFEKIYRNGFRSCIFTSHLPLRRGFTYNDTGVDCQSKMLWETKLLSATKLVTCPSLYVAKFLKDEYGQSGSKIRVIPHGVNCNRFTPFDDHRNADQANVLAVGRLAPQKAFDLLIRSWPAVRERYPTSRLTILGDGGCRTYLLGLIARLHLEDTIRLVGEKSGSELTDYYRRADLLIISSHFEPFGLVGLEAMACDCPVLSIGPSGASEYLQPEEQIYEYSPSRIGASIAHRLSCLKHDLPVRELIRQRALQRSWSITASKYLGLYREILS